MINRLKNLWKLSAYKPSEPKQAYKDGVIVPDTQMATIVKKVPIREKYPEVFFKREKISPIQELVNQDPYES